VVLYFFWNDNTTGGSFTFPVVFMFDTPIDDAEDPNSEFFGFSLAMCLAACCSLLWAVVVALPLVLDTSSSDSSRGEEQEGRQHMRSLQRSPVFTALHVLFSRILFGNYNANNLHYM
jgi:hypothetical protein